jgi:hypothetical protein
MYTTFDQEPAAMKRSFLGAIPLLCALAVGLATAPVAHAAPFVNGDFESGLAGWTSLNETGGDGSFMAHGGTVSPVNLDPVPASPGGFGAAMSDGGGPGSHLLYQDFVASADAKTLSFGLPSAPLRAPGA